MPLDPPWSRAPAPDAPDAPDARSRLLLVRRKRQTQITLGYWMILAHIGTTTLLYTAVHCCTRKYEAKYIKQADRNWRMNLVIAVSSCSVFE